MRNRAGGVTLALVSLVLHACENATRFYAPPVQRPALDGFRPYRVVRIVDVSDDVDPYFVSDITGMSGGSWRWTRQRPTVRVVLPKTNDLHYLIDFTIYDRAFRDTGPLTISYFVNDRLLDTIRYEMAGLHHFEKAVPAEWMQPGMDATVAAEVDKPWIDPETGEKLGILLFRIGLSQNP